MTGTRLVNLPVFFVAALPRTSLDDMTDDSVAKNLSIGVVQGARVHFRMKTRETGNWRMAIS